jgi:hypothetical protein
MKPFFNWKQSDLCWIPLRSQSAMNQNGFLDLQVQRRMFKKRKKNLKVGDMLQIKRYFGLEHFSTG